MAGSIHSEADAQTFVDTVSEELTGHNHMSWTTKSIRHRVARAEYEAASDQSRLIPEQRLVDVWNEYIREIDAPEEALITVAELHNLRDSMYIGASRFGWKRDVTQSIWTMPNIYALDANGKVANGCRAMEALKVIHDMHEMFMNVSAARERIRKGVVASDVVKQASQEANLSAPHAPVVRTQLVARTYRDPVRPAAYRYRQEHGTRAYDLLLRRLFDELLPAN
jgi:hypothetical protein